MDKEINTLVIPPVSPRHLLLTAIGVLLIGFVGLGVHLPPLVAVVLAVIAVPLVLAALPWWPHPLVGLLPPLLAGGLAAWVRMINHPAGAHVAEVMWAQVWVVIALLVLLGCGQRWRLAQYFIPALGIGLGVSLASEVLFVQISPVVIVAVISVLLSQFIALTVVLWRLHGVIYSALLWALVVVVALVSNQRQLLQAQGDLLALHAHLKSQSVAAVGPLGLRDRGDYLGAFSWGIEAAPIHVHLVGSTSLEAVDQLRQQSREFLQLEEAVRAGRIWVTFDLVADDHLVPLLAYRLVAAMARVGVSDPGRELLAVIAASNGENLQLTMLDSVESRDPGTEGLLRLSIEAPGILRNLDQRTLAIRRLGVPAKLQVLVTRSAGIRKKQDILLRSSAVITATTINSYK